MAHGLPDRFFVSKTVLISYALASVFKNSVRYIIILASFSSDIANDLGYKKQFCGNIFHFADYFLLNIRFVFSLFTVCQNLIHPELNYQGVFSVIFQIRLLFRSALTCPFSHSTFQLSAM